MQGRRASSCGPPGRDRYCRDRQRRRARGVLRHHQRRGGAGALAELRDRIDDFDPNTRYRFLAGAFLSADWYVKAHQFRRWYSQQLAGLFQNWDVILAPVVPIPAPRFSYLTTGIDGDDYALRPLLGRFVQALAPAGLPIVAAPYVQPSALPVGVQIIAAPFREDNALRIAAALETSEFLPG